MADREKVLKGLGCCIQQGVEDVYCRELDCHYKLDSDSCRLNCWIKLLMDAVSLLKAQEPGWISVKDRMPEYDKDVLIYAVSKTTNESKIAISYLMDKFYFGSRPINLKEPIWHDPWQYFRENNKPSPVTDVTCRGGVMLA